MLHAEVHKICWAQRYEQSAERADIRAGHYERKLDTKASQVALMVPKLC